ncbi:dihydrofolate reductase [Alkalihalobacillus trypoxylicola]|uniref:Dihydrofolate reductase n=1 Tax=Alkalihalobacillus trypoxylicola TaxID=519424 RepID=A0A161PIN2_9BACI|nr:dihydrofolate reductase [Alkalihalobacillus trypoxylicola]KYG33554.1 dihydrofolate reductase [Alkalihalobacillus trypoxylicola]
MISYIFAADENLLLGKDNDMPWYLPNDLQYFKKVTSGSTVVMGRKTFESLGRPLPKRRNIILTRDSSYKAEGCEVFHSIEDVLRATADEQETFVIGGANVFQLFHEVVEKMYITKIKETFNGDTYFPDNWPWEEWKLVEKTEGIVDEKNHYHHEFLVYERM